MDNYEGINFHQIEYKWKWDILGHGEVVASLMKSSLWHRIITRILFLSKWTRLK